MDKPKTVTIDSSIGIFLEELGFGEFQQKLLSSGYTKLDLLGYLHDDAKIDLPFPVKNAILRGFVEYLIIF